MDLVSSMLDQRGVLPESRQLITQFLRRPTPSAVVMQKLFNLADDLCGGQEPSWRMLLDSANFGREDCCICNFCIRSRAHQDRLLIIPNFWPMQFDEGRTCQCEKCTNK